MQWDECWSTQDPKEINPALGLSWVLWNRDFPAQHSQEMEIPTNGAYLGQALPCLLLEQKSP